MIDLLKNILLFMISVLFAIIVFGLCFVLTNVFLIITFRFSDLSQYYFDCALTNDQSGNVYCKHALDFSMAKNGKHFGNPDETVSSRLGKLKNADELSSFGKLISGILNRIDENHVEKSIEIDEL